MFAVVLGWRARVAFEIKGDAPENESFLHTRKVVNIGIYAVVQHPMYNSFLLLSLGLIFISQYWPTTLLGVVVIGFLYYEMHLEEQNNVTRFCDDYRLYMQQVPKMNFAVGLVQLLQRRRGGEYMGYG